MKSLWATVKRHGRRSVGGIVVSAPNSAQDEVRHGNTAPTASGAVSYTHLTLPTILLV